ncbi:putative s-adenosyl-l-methionine-dependent methyltransferase [Golovinomyces cichoracearum]|uniref:Putative s-adenosyl-l-methionine-dependent methyltransferase n=1 Tax=Golovinomyces cichoracearum TaxID=62708 RepID=A0A420ISU1_9PEZI|nr:putative s-adenosyl-l-methionine-dependent methyltransferase [Golovinomyces cichoracearum]
MDMSSSDIFVIPESEIPDFFVETEGKDSWNYKYVLKKYLLQRDAEFRRLSEFRHRGWEINKEEGDAFFKIQRYIADNANQESRKFFFGMMIKIAKDMHQAAGIFDFKANLNRSPRILDICMAPGGFTAAALNICRNARCYGLTLPKKLGGHELILEKSKLCGLHQLDITMMIKEYSDSPIPHNHPQIREFTTIRLFNSYKFDLIFCDGKVLRTHQRPTWRENNEGTRLMLSQLILSMQRIRNGGTIVVLLHKIDCWDSILTIRDFSDFSDIQLYKPPKAHKTRSSFYLIARNIDIEHEKAKRTLRFWRDQWWEATFGGEDGLGKKLHPSVGVVEELLDDFGEQFIRIARPIWRIQADGLSRTIYAGNFTDLNLED